MYSNYYIELEKKLCSVLGISYCESKSYEEWLEESNKYYEKLNFNEFVSVVEVLELLKCHK